MCIPGAGSLLRHNPSDFGSVLEDAFDKYNSSESDGAGVGSRGGEAHREDVVGDSGVELRPAGVAPPGHAASRYNEGELVADVEVPWGLGGPPALRTSATKKRCMRAQHRPASRQVNYHTLGLCPEWVSCVCDMLSS